jgi:alcohol dehydrogenase
MLATFFKNYGDLESNIIQKDIPLPVPADDEVLIKVFAASMNPVDYKIVHGAIRLLHRFKLPQALGYDVSGTIERTGKNVTAFKPGDEVYGRAGDFDPGTFAEYAIIKAIYIAPKPHNLTHEEASCIPLAGQTAVQAISEVCDAQPGQKILIHAGAGGVGSFAIQYAKLLGLHVATTTSTRNMEWVRSLGADEVIDYTTRDYRKELKDFDIVLDSLGGASRIESMKVLKPGGKIVSIVGKPDRPFAIRMKLGFLLTTLITLIDLKHQRAARKHKVIYYYWLMRPDGETLSGITPFLESGKIRVFIEEIYPLNRALEALKHVEKGRTRGKVVISTDGSRS